MLASPSISSGPSSLELLKKEEEEEREEREGGGLLLCLISINVHPHMV
jgi:hypothetical protein